MPHHLNSGSFKKGQIAWNKGKTNYWLKGKPRPKSVIDKIKKAHLGVKKPWAGQYKVKPLINKKCAKCGKGFSVIESRKNRAKFCSIVCKFAFQRNFIPINKGKFKSKNYGGYHYKVRKIRGTPKLCEQCGTTTAKKFEWANLTGNYKGVSSGYGDGSGDGSGYGNGDGSGYGNGYGNGYG